MEKTLPTEIHTPGTLVITHMATLSNTCTTQLTVITQLESIQSWESNSHTIFVQ